jgi:hypothetical protein
LEIGLLEDYLKLNLSCDPAINKYFTCDIKLLNNEGNGTWSFESDDKQSPMKSVLNYLDDMDTSIN